mmetsp:Transcript_84798/g.133964  ORF Transcript_84798/g.133964 Transcript_84798/m.133964 type:complete len:204 (-) Transcript_84798:146-757(-)
MSIAPRDFKVGSPIAAELLLLLPALTRGRFKASCCSDASKTRMPSETTAGLSAELRFNFLINSGSKLSDAGTGFGNSGPSPDIMLTNSSSRCFFSIHSLMRSTAYECRKRRPVRSRIASKFLVFLPLPPCFFSNAPKPPFPPSNRKITRTVHILLVSSFSLNTVADFSSSSLRIFSPKRMQKSGSSSSSSCSKPIAEHIASRR